MQQKMKQYKEHVYELENELEERAVTIATYKEKVLSSWKCFFDRISI